MSGHDEKLRHIFSILLGGKLITWNLVTEHNMWTKDVVRLSLAFQDQADDPLKSPSFANIPYVQFNNSTNGQLVDISYGDGITYIRYVIYDIDLFLNDLEKNVRQELDKTFTKELEKELCTL